MGTLTKFLNLYCNNARFSLTNLSHFPHSPQSQPVPSPAPPPTPLLPASPATSVGSPAHSSVTPEENEAYLRTHHELQVYLPLLTRMMNRTLKKEGEDAHKSEQYMKLKSLHSLLQDDKKRCGQLTHTHTHTHTLTYSTH